ncbi:hypothetical protein [Micromonospora sp. NPDC001898]|uniref:hypothetical protein n=1 Tax=Micromonospora sp. NPDC001898 TaxID=3364221 RepID=UPI0036CBD570
MANLLVRPVPERFREPAAATARSPATATHSPLLPPLRVLVRQWAPVPPIQAAERAG